MTARKKKARDTEVVDPTESPTKATAPAAPEFTYEDGYRDCAGNVLEAIKIRFGTGTKMHWPTDLIHLLEALASGVWPVEPPERSVPKLEGEDV